MKGTKMNRTEKWKEKRNQLKKETADLDEYYTKLELENERLKVENDLLKKELEIDEIMINFMKELVEFDG